MRVAVVTSSPPLSEGGHLVIARSLVEALHEAGHEAGLVLTPQNRFDRIASSYLATWLTDVEVAFDGGRIDRVISLRYPSYAVRHERHVVWLNHRLREFYDLWDRFHPTLSRRRRIQERVRRRIVHAVDGYLLTRRVRRVFAQSATIRDRLRRMGNIPSEVLYPPAPQRPYRCDGYGPEFLAVSRLTPLKRLDLLVRALAEPAAQGVRCTIAGDGEQETTLRGLINDLGLAGRVTLVGRLETPALVPQLAACRAVVFPAYEEDYGLVTVEAFASAKPVVTCRDSGGPAELVEAGRTGLVCDPTPASLATALATLAGDQALAERMGTAARARAATMTWAAAINTLLHA
ncbi:MAG: glycosyltransferase family 4 protein [Acidobacteria bacterium]|nr:glycosyltransferase family 4 protein [Acidobacteriota bacterium]